jgi:hypothetical protein
MKKTKNSVYLRYEFTNEAGKLEGGDIFEFSTLSEAEGMSTEILKVAHSDGVAVNVTIGAKKAFFGFLKNVGMTSKDVKNEMVEQAFVPAQTKSKKSSSKKTSKKLAKKTAKKKSKK